MENLIKELREDFQIPPYASDDTLQRFLTEGIAYFTNLVPDADFDKDQIYRSLLKNHAYYAYNHVLNEFYENYKKTILGWQIGQEVTET